MFSYLPGRIKDSLRYCNSNLLYELRIRAQKPVAVNYGGEYKLLGERGVGAINAFIATKKEVEDIVLSAAEYSLYSVTEQIRKGFITTPCGERIGIAGQGVSENGEVLNVRNISSVCIRIPHQVVGCAGAIAPYCLEPKLCDTAILSPPGFGKTTLLRDAARLLGEKGGRNVLIVDERGELSAFDTGIMSDVISCIDKRTAIMYGIRAMRPDVLITDELSEDDYAAIKRAMAAGVKVLASFHADSPAGIPDFFERYVLLGERIGNVLAIYDAAKELLA